MGAENPGAGLPSIAGGSGLGMTVAADGILSVLGTDAVWSMDVYSTDGIVCASYNGHGASTVSTAALAPGIYIARAVSEGASATLRFVRR